MTYREFFLKDHLGNIRVRYVDKNGNGLIEVDTTDQKVNELTGSYHYYPFGMEWDGGKYRKHPTNPPPTEGNFFYNQDVQNKYRYNGKEFIEDYGISLYEYGAQWYDPAVGRFICVDPIADKFPELSVYNYASNDPVKNIDLHGLQGHRADMHLHNEMREQKGNQEYEDAKKSIQQVEKKALISIGAIAILLIPTPEDILLGLAINGLSKAGKIVKAGRAVEKVVSKTDEVVDAAKTSTKLLGAAPANLTQKGLDHIIARHWFTSGAKGAGKFAEGTTGASLKEMIHTASTQGVFRANTAGRAGTIAEYNFGRVIGTTSGGAPASNLRVVIGTNGNVITAFPY